MVTLENFLDNKVKLPSPPVVALRILEAVKQNEHGFDELAKIISSDPALTVQTLKIANSSLYQLPNCVTSLSQAISLIGTQSLKNIALSFVIIDNFQDAPQGSFNIDLFWKRAICAAVAADTLARETGLIDHDVFVAALLQDLGVLVIFLSDPAAYTSVLDTKRLSGKSLCEAEKDHFGFTHAEVSHHLFQTWGLPESIFAPILHHHDTESASSYHDATLILNIADKISSLYHGMQSNKKSIEIHALLQDKHGFQESQTTALIDLIGERTIETLECFSISAGDMKPFSQIMQEANDKLGQLNYSYEQIVLELTQAKQNAELLANELKIANDSLRELTFRDGLTNLYNHRYFQDILESELLKSRQYNSDTSLLFLDIDFFKKVNDTFGHPAGDHALIELGKTLVNLVRHGDIVARYGGEEFAIILPNTGLKSAKVLAQRLCRGAEQRQIYYNDQPIPLTVSIGLASTEIDRETLLDRETLIRSSDEALYRAKNNGRNRVELY